MISRGDFLKIVAGDPNLKRVESNNSGFRLRVHGPIAMVSTINKTLNCPPAGIRVTRVFVKQNSMWKQLVTRSTTVVQQ